MESSSSKQIGWLVLFAVVAASMLASLASGYCLINDFKPCFQKGEVVSAEDCCGIVRNVTIDCVCQAVSSPDAGKQGVNISHALSLPLKCGVTVPPGSLCAGLPVPT